MPYKDKEVQKQKQRELMQRQRLVNPVNREPNVNPEKPSPVNPKSVNPIDKPLDPWDWRDRRNYSDVYLKCLDKQGGTLTEASIVALKIARKPMVVERSVDPSRVAKAKAVLSALS